MTPKAPSLTPYDFLGYIVPGLLFVWLIDMSIVSHYRENPITYDDIIARYFEMKLAGIIPLMLIAYIVGHIISFTSSVLIERHAVWLHGNPTNVLVNNGEIKPYFQTGGKSPIASLLFRVSTVIILLPISILDFMFGKVIPVSKNYFRPFDDLIKHAAALAIYKIMRQLKIKTQDADLEKADIHRLGLHYSLEAAPAHVSSLRNYVVLYGFLRSLTLIIVISSWVIIYHINGHFVWWKVCLVSVFVCVLSFVTYAAYLKFWTRYHKEAIMALIACTLNKSKD